MPELAVPRNPRALIGHHHVCAFFNSTGEESRVLLPFIKQGIDSGEKASHVVDPSLSQVHLDRLAHTRTGVDITR